VSEAAVRFNEVWKKFRRGQRHDSLRDLIPSAIGRVFGRPHSDATELRSREFWAVRCVSFEVRPGEALGIIGPNGAGKSTILKLLTRILKPTRGHCEVRGRAGALIEVAAGFHHDLTGRENVYLQGAIMGMKRAEIVRKFDEIVDFAGAGEFIDTQVKRYSTGMSTRLGFAIAAHLDPDVLLVDEVLSVGDAAFREKCTERMRELLRREIPLLFISHNLPAVLEICTRVMVIDRGTVRFEGDPARAIQEYRLVPWTNPGAQGSESGSPVWIARVELLNERGESSAVFQTMGGMRVRVDYEAVRPVRNAVIAVDIHRGDGFYCAGVSTLIDRHDLGVLDGVGHVELVFPRLALLPGWYLGSVRILDATSGSTYDRQNRAYPFSVMSDRRDLGVVYLDREWSHQPSTPAADGRGAVPHAYGTRPDLPALPRTQLQEAAPVRRPPVSGRD
jgi:lipopolysaccharide transport system ATP-binding protein